MQSLVLSFPQRQYIKAAHAAIDAANMGLKDAKEQVALDASTAYIDLDTVTRELAAAQQQEGFTADLLRIQQQRTEAGVDSDVDLLQTRLSAAQIKLQRVHLESRATTLAKQLAVLTGLPSAPSLRITPASPKFPPSPRTCLPSTLPGLTPQEISLNPSSSRPRETTWRGVAPQLDSEPSTTTIPTS